MIATKKKGPAPRDTIKPYQVVNAISAAMLEQCNAGNPFWTSDRKIYRWVLTASIARRLNTSVKRARYLCELLLKDGKLLKARQPDGVSGYSLKKLDGFRAINHDYLQQIPKPLPCVEQMVASMNVL